MLHGKLNSPPSETIIIDNSYPALYFKPEVQWFRKSPKHSCVFLTHVLVDIVMEMTGCVLKRDLILYLTTRYRQMGHSQFTIYNTIQTIYSSEVECWARRRVVSSRCEYELLTSILPQNKNAPQWGGALILRPHYEGSLSMLHLIVRAQYQCYTS